MHLLHKGLFASKGGASEGIRTPDPRFTKALLCRLSYAGLCLAVLMLKTDLGNLLGNPGHRSTILPINYSSFITQLRQLTDYIPGVFNI
jgi:hypothetical protein